MIEFRIATCLHGIENFERFSFQAKNDSEAIAYFNNFVEETFGPNPKCSITLTNARTKVVLDYDLIKETEDAGDAVCNQGSN